MAHELAHVKNRDTLISTVAVTIAAAIMMLPSFARWGAIFGVGGRDGERGSGSNVVVLLATAIVARQRPLPANPANREAAEPIILVVKSSQAKVRWRGATGPRILEGTPPLQVSPARPGGRDRP